MDNVSILVVILLTITGTLGLLELVFWFAEKRRVERLAYFVATAGACGFAIFEIGMAHAETWEQYIYLLRMAQPFAFAAVAGAAWFIYSGLKTGRRWLFWTFIGLRAITVALNFILPNGVNWIEVTGMAQVTIWGEVLHYPVGIPNPTSYIPLFSFVVLMVFAFDASFRAWRPGDRIRVAVQGFGVAFCALTILSLVFGIVFGYFRSPVFVGPAFLFIIAAMSFQMLMDMRNTARVSETLQESEEKLKDAIDQLQLSADSGDVGLWRRDFDNPVFWSNEKAREMFGFDPDAEIGPREFIDHVHEDDRERVVGAMKEIEMNNVPDFDIEFRIRRHDGEVRWVHCRGDILRGNPLSVRGASVDVTKRKNAEHEAHELARKLIDAQEDERARLARDLHDGLGQSIALLSIHVGELQKNAGESLHVNSGVENITKRLQVLGSDVRRISHELHPSKLKQLGMEVALAGFCREISEAHGTKVNFSASSLPTEIDDDLAICFYRVAQEALRNIIKHAKATKADVRIAVESGELVLTVSDDGIGFDVESARSKGTLGLVSINERMLAVSGESKIHSTPGNGTRIEARAPIKNGLNG